MHVLIRMQRACLLGKIKFKRKLTQKKYIWMVELIRHMYSILQKISFLWAYWATNYNSGKTYKELFQIGVSLGLNTAVALGTFKI